VATVDNGDGAAKTRRLNFAAVDDLCFANERGRLDLNRARFRFLPDELTPALELRHYSAGTGLPRLGANPWIGPGAVSSMVDALDHGTVQWVNPQGGLTGFIRTRWDPYRDETTWFRFALAMRRAAAVSGFPSALVKQFEAAITELWTNIYEHANGWDTGLIAFQASRNSFAFVVADAGIGVLRSLQSSPEFSTLRGHGDALRAALTEGTSRYGSGKGRGYGFRQMFLSLRALDVALRFRSGDHALTLDGQNPTLTEAVLHQKATLGGFLVSAVCRAPRVKRLS
jgi:anti-sigma regulatory factor (Ser/Thr protein kinase)